jgi:hypothetical protein
MLAPWSAVNHEHNPYAPPKHDGPAATGDSALEAIRRAHINAETNVKTLGFLLYLGAASSIIGGLRSLEIDLVGALMSIGFGGAFGVAGYWLRRLDARGRNLYTAALVLSIGRVMLSGDLMHAGMGVAVGTLAWPILLLAIVWMEKAGTVMTPHYRDVVIPATPHVKRKTSVLVIVLGVILLGLLAVAIVGALR